MALSDDSPDIGSVGGLTRSVTRPRLLFCIPELDHGGPDAVFFNLVRTIDRDRFETMLAVTKPHGLYLSELPNDIPVHVVGHARYPVAATIKLVRELRPQIVVSTLRMNMTCAAASPFFPAGTTLVTRVANNITWDMGQIRGPWLKVRAISLAHRISVARSDLVITQSQAMHDDVVARFGPRVVDKTVVLPNPVDLDRIGLRAELDMAVPVRTGNPQLVSAGRLTYQKGFDVLISSFATVRARHPGARLWILGQGEDRDSLARLIDRHGLGDAVDLVGFIENPAPYYRAADLYVCSSRYEGFPNSLAEALATGTPIVAPAGAAAGTELVSDVNGLIVDRLTERDLAQTTLAALDRLGQFDAEAIRADCRERFSISAVTSRYEDAITSATV
jgi:glycosyltransferase involved in cell wall biosynthesis